MDKYIFDEGNGLWYEYQGDYYIPCLSLPAEDEQPVGPWGQRHLRYIKEHRKARYTNLLVNGKLNSRLANIDQQAQGGWIPLFSNLLRLKASPRN